MKVNNFLKFFFENQFFCLTSLPKKYEAKFLGRKYKSRIHSCVRLTPSVIKQNFIPYQIVDERDARDKDHLLSVVNPFDPLELFDIGNLLSGGLSLLEPIADL